MSTDPTGAIRTRYVEAMMRIISTNREVKNRVGFARRVQTDSPMISRWQNGTGTPTLEHIFHLCNEFGVSAQWLILGEGKMFGDDELSKKVRDLEKRMADVEMIVKLKKESV